MSGYSFLCVDEGGVLLGAVEVDRLAGGEVQADFGGLIGICRPIVSREAVCKAPDRHPPLDFPALYVGGGQRVERDGEGKFLRDDDKSSVCGAGRVNRFDCLLIEGGGKVMTKGQERLR